MGINYEQSQQCLHPQLNISLYLSRLLARLGKRMQFPTKAAEDRSERIKRTAELGSARELFLWRRNRSRKYLKLPFWEPLTRLRAITYETQF